jgi:hypothetical protein
MQRASALALSAFLLLGLSPAQEPRPEHAPRPELTKAARVAAKKMVRAMQGAWRLVDIQLVTQDTFGLDDLKLDHVGFCVVSGHYICLEFHFRLLGQPRMDVGRSFVTGIHRFEFDEEGRMETSTVIGTRANEGGEPEFEPPESQRRYDVTIEGDSMTLRREDGHTLMFQRLEDDASRLDFYGNPVPEKDDIYNDGEKDGQKDKKKKDEGDEDG